MACGPPPENKQKCRQPVRAAAAAAAAAPPARCRGRIAGRARVYTYITTLQQQIKIIKNNTNNN
jgi:hypothetical protein